MKDWQAQSKISTRRASRCLSLIFLLCAILLIGGALAACDLATNVKSTMKQVNTSLPERSFTVGTQARLVFSTGIADVQIHSGNSDKITVNAKFSAIGIGLDSQLDSNTMQIDTSQKGDTVTVNAKANTSVVGSEHFNVAITVPHSCAVEVHDSTGKVEVEDVSGSLAINTGSSDIHVSNVDGPMTIESNDGRIELQKASLKGQSRLKTSTGDINFHGSLDPQGSYQVKTRDGRITMNLPPDAAFSLKTSSNDGRIRNSFDSKEVGSEPRARLEIQSNTGDIAVKKEG
ncbi:hypothetical protein EPA93_02175 [Ktedonosporobacter rubrisoli]|uniref:DUF4097 domain-containing protein n=1 Tax=Ktedonosporobacter rubrisoli TaxID=2509675 RepID=A0A4P6JIP1_KTERU|nr:DUF4097 family beta strand repeat-containing protein [Ktedonosporobacter rubrisoli]QBD74863.1 hypothetical protein EPA93_02175 [Ktedonosporobacter rubrisoli]